MNESTGVFLFFTCIYIYIYISYDNMIIYNCIYIYKVQMIHINIQLPTSPNIRSFQTKPQGPSSHLALSRENPYVQAFSISAPCVVSKTSAFLVLNGEATHATWQHLEVQESEETKGGTRCVCSSVDL